MILQDTIDALKKRYAVKKFNPAKKLTEEELIFLEEVLQLTPSSFGFEPWKFVIVGNKEIKEKLFPYSRKNRQVLDASHLIVLCAKEHVGTKDVQAFLKRTMDLRGVGEGVLANLKKTLYGVVWTRNLNAWLLGLPEFIFGTQIFRQWQTKQVYIALGNLLSACAHQNIGAAPMEGFHQRAYKRILGNAVEGYRPVLLCAVGHHAEDDIFAAMPKVRKTKEEVIVRI